MAHLGGMRFVVKETAGGGQCYFVVQAAGNHAVLATSETYARKADALEAIRLIKAGAPGATVVVEDE